MATKKTGASLQAIQAQIAALQSQADEIRKQEVAEVVARIKEAITQYGLTAADLGFIPGAKAYRAPAAKQATGRLGRKAGPKAGTGTTKTKPASVHKYTDGQGRTWIGIGKRPGGCKEFNHRAVP